MFNKSMMRATLLYVYLTGNARVLWQYKEVSGTVWGVPSRTVATLPSWATSPTVMSGWSRNFSE
jgi:hypothetical protein